MNIRNVHGFEKYSLTIKKFIKSENVREFYFFMKIEKGEEKKKREKKNQKNKRDKNKKERKHKIINQKEKPDKQRKKTSQNWAEGFRSFIKPAWQHPYSRKLPLNGLEA